MSALRVLVVGGANVDVKVTAAGPTAEGISTPGRVHVIPGGVARNVAEALARLGATVRLLTVVGADAWGEWLMTQTALAGVDTTAVIQDPGQTGFYVTIGGRGVADATIVEATPAEVWLRAPREDTDLVVLDANPAEATLPELARRASRLALVGTSPAKVSRLRSLLPHAWLVCLTLAEARALIDPDNGTLEGAALARAVQALGPEWVLLTEGRRGLGLLGKAWTAVPAQPGPVINETGAGDTAAALVMFGLLRGWSAERVLLLAARAATMTLGVWGNVHPEVGTVLIEGRAS